MCTKCELSLSLFLCFSLPLFEIFGSMYLDAIEHGGSIFVQLYNTKSIPSAASGNRRVKRKIDGERERERESKRRRDERRDRGGMRSIASHCMRMIVRDCYIRR